MTAINYVYGICNKLVNDKQLAEDLTVEVINGLDTRFRKNSLNRNDILFLVNQTRKLIVSKKIMSHKELSSKLFFNR